MLAQKFGQPVRVVAIEAKKRADGSGLEYLQKNGGPDRCRHRRRRVRRKSREPPELEKFPATPAWTADGTKAGYDIVDKNDRRERRHPGHRIRRRRNAGAFYDALTWKEKPMQPSPHPLFHYKELEIREVKEYLAGP